jgi:peptide deformylase
MIAPINDVNIPDQLAILKRPSKKGEVSTAVSLAQHLEETARQYPNCVGLASNQIWDKPNEDTPHVFVAHVGGVWRTFINATSRRHGKRGRVAEGCMSKPGYKTHKIRFERITITYLDAQGIEKTEHFQGMDAVIIQHELDHLTGALI